MKATFPLPPRLLHRHRLLKCVQWNQHLPIGTMNFTRSNIVNNLCFNQLISGDCGNKGKLLPCTVADLTGREGTVRNWMRWTILISISKSGKCLGRFHVNFFLRLRDINMTPPLPIGYAYSTLTLWIMLRTVLTNLHPCLLTFSRIHVV